MPTFQIVPDVYVRGVGPGYLPRAGLVCRTLSSVETTANNKPDMVGVKITLQVEHAYVLGPDGKFGAPDPQLAGREISVNAWYPKPGDNERHGISNLLTILVAYGAFSKEQAKELIANRGAFNFGPGMFDGRPAFVLNDPPPDDAPGDNNFPETIWLDRDTFSKVVSNELSVTWPWDKKSAKMQAKVAANPAASSAGQLVNTAAATPTPRPASAPTTPTPASFAAPPTSPVVAGPPVGGPPPAWTPGTPAPTTFAAPPPNGAQAPTWPSQPAAPTAAPTAQGW